MKCFWIARVDSTRWIAEDSWIIQVEPPIIGVRCHRMDCRILPHIIQCEYSQQNAWMQRQFNATTKTLHTKETLLRSSAYRRPSISSAFTNCNLQPTNSPVGSLCDSQCFRESKTKLKSSDQVGKKFRRIQTIFQNNHMPLVNNRVE